MDEVSREALRILRLFGDTTTKRVVASVGAEQEYFLLPKDMYAQREDLRLTGRTLFGALPPKGPEFFGADRECSVAREISKKFEEHKRGTVSEVAAWYKEHEPKGEIVIIVAGAPERKKEKKRYDKKDED